MGGKIRFVYLYRANSIGHSMEQTTVVQEQIKTVTGVTSADVM